MIAGFVIHTPEGLTDDQRVRAAELGPSEVAADGSPSTQLIAAGFEVVTQLDLTEGFTRTCRALLGTRNKAEDSLRAIEGDDDFEEELLKKREMLKGIEAGLLQRSLVTGRRPARH